MKRKIKIIDNTSNTIINGMITIRNADHFNVQLNTRAHVFKAKKGKASYTRKIKHKDKSFNN